MKRIVWLASWYPTEVDVLTGDFIRRHAQACSLLQPLHVIHVKKYAPNSKKGKRIVESTDPDFPHLRETICHYSAKNIGFPGRIFSYAYSLWLYHALVKQFIRQHGKPHLLHVHVMLRCGLVALYFKWFHKIPYVVTEQYSGYMPEAKGILKGITPLNYWPLKLIAEHAEAVAPVSLSLANALQQSFAIKTVVVIPNTVDTRIFFPQQGVAKNIPPTFLHISTLTPQKNPVKMLQGFALLKSRYQRPFQLWIVGPDQPGFKQLAADLQISHEIKWLAETTQQNIAAFMQQVSAQVLYSCFESFGCVNMEALACGVPVIVSDLPVFREYLPQGSAAWFADGNDPSALAEVLNSFISSGPTENRRDISDFANNFDYGSIGTMLCRLYQRAIDK